MHNTEAKLRTFLAWKREDSPVSSFESQLAALWETPEQLIQALPSDRLKGLVRKTLAENDDSLERLRPSLLVRHMFDSLPEPVLVFGSMGNVWNRVFDELLASDSQWQWQFPALRRVEAVQSLARIVLNAARLGRSVILFPLANQIYSIRVVALPDDDVHIGYLSPVGGQLPPLDSSIQACFCLRLAGLRSKEIAFLIDAPKHHVEHIFKRYPGAFRAVRSTFATFQGNP